jgi:hypothetical protein
MTRIVPLLVAFLVSALPAQAATITFSATLDGTSESPSNASPATGLALVTIDDILHTLRVQVTFADLTAPNTAAHIHVINGPGDANTSDTLGPVATMTPTFTGFPAGQSGNYDATFDFLLVNTYRAGWLADSGGTPELAAMALLSGIAEGRAYLNIHTSNFPGGEIRGFLQPQPVAAVPEPASLLLMGTGLAVAGARRRRQRRSGAKP